MSLESVCLLHPAAEGIKGTQKVNSHSEIVLHSLQSLFRQDKPSYSDIDGHSLDIGTVVGVARYV